MVGQFLLVAIATAVPGPPMAALLAVKRACKHVTHFQRCQMRFNICLGLYTYLNPSQCLLVIDKLVQHMMEGLTFSLLHVPA